MRVKKTKRGQKRWVVINKILFLFFRLRYSQIREGIIRCILATDMARHNEILTQFKEVTPIFDYSNRAHINLVREQLLSLLVFFKLTYIYSL